MKLRPTLRYRHINDIPIEILRKMDIRLILADMDNTLAPWHSTEVSQEIVFWIEEVQNAGIEVLMLTNSKSENADITARQLGIGVIKDARKPMKKHTRNLLAQKGVNAEQTLIVGDQLFTDIQLANALGIKSVLLEPLSNREWWCTKVFNRSRERLVWPFLFRK